MSFAYNFIIIILILITIVMKSTKCDPRRSLKWSFCLNCKLSDLHDKLDYEQSLQQKGVAQLLQIEEVRLKPSRQLRV